jgi:hypothetical protein
MPKEPSEHFIRTFTMGGTPVATCGFCGRVNFATGDPSLYDESELERLLEKQQQEPERYVSHGDDSVSHGEIAGRALVEGCPCNLATTYEDFIWDNRHRILEYLTKRSTAERKEAADIVTAVERVGTHMKALRDVVHTDIASPAKHGRMLIHHHDQYPTGAPSLRSDCGELMAEKEHHVSFDWHDVTCIKCLATMPLSLS